MNPKPDKNIEQNKLEAHLKIDKYGDFVLTDAIRPSLEVAIEPIEGYKHDQYKDTEDNSSIPVLMCSISKERLFDIFIEFIDILGDIVDVVLETSHDAKRREHDDLYREHIDLPVLKSYLYQYEDMIFNDGCMGIAVLNPDIPAEIQFDEHKLLIVYGENLQPFEKVLSQHNIPLNEDLRFLTEAEHVHTSQGDFIDQFRALQSLLGMDHNYE